MVLVHPLREVSTGIGGVFFLVAVRMCSQSLFRRWQQWQICWAEYQTLGLRHL